MQRGTERIVPVIEDPEWIDVRPAMPVRLRASGEYVVLHDHWIPATIEVQTIEDVAADPQTYLRVEVTESGPRLVELRYYSVDPESPGIRQTDLRETDVRSMVEDLVAMFTARIERDPSGGGVVRSSLSSQDFTEHLRFVGKMRSGVTRNITPDLLRKVATVYRDNIDRHPTKAVQHHFQVSQRMAAEYVSRARKAGHLPPTKRGKKQA